MLVCSAPHGPATVAEVTRREPACAAGSGAPGRGRGRYRHGHVRTAAGRARPHGRIGSLAFVLDGRPQPVDGQAMPRLDPYEAPARRRARTAAASGGWSRIDRPPAEGAYALRLRATLEDGRVVDGSSWPGSPWPSRSSRWRRAGPTTAVCRASRSRWRRTTRPTDLLARQLDSIRAQTHENWVCVISDDCSRPERYQRFSRRSAATSGSCSRARRAGSASTGISSARWRWSPRMPGTSRSPTRTTTGAPASSRRCSTALGEAQLVYSDARVVEPRRRADLRDVVEPSAATTTAICSRCWSPTRSPARRRCSAASCWTTRCRFRPPSSPTSTTTGSGWSRSRSAGSRTCPRRCTTTSSTARRRSGTQRANRMTSLRERLAHQRRPRERVHMWRLHYFVDIWRLRQFATVL